MISSNSFEPGEDHLPYKKALAGHDFGFGDITEKENNMNKGSKALLQGNDVYAKEKKQKPCETKEGCKKCGNEKKCKPAKSEKVDHPVHYKPIGAKYEAIDVIEDWDLGFSDGNAVKYICRHRFKNNPVEDIEKAIWYLKRHLETLKALEK
jgi:hypothetical protein